jgi:hypothetical protein
MASLAKTVHVEPDALKAFADAVYTRYGKLRGVLCKEATIALRAHAERILAEDAAAMQQADSP